MALKIDPNSPHWKEIVDVLHRFADHSNVCDVCNVTTGAYCSIGGEILHELTMFGDAVQEVPEDWKGDK